MEKRTSFTCTRKRVMASSTMTGQPIGRSRRLMAGRNCSPFSTSTWEATRWEQIAMCTGIVETAKMSGSGKGAKGWFKLDQVNVSYDHPFDASMEHTLNIDFVNQTEGPGSRVAVELSP